MADLEEALRSALESLEEPKPKATYVRKSRRQRAKAREAQRQTELTILKKTGPHGWRGVFLEALGRTSNVTAAARIAGVSRAHVYATANKLPVFARLIEERKEQSLDEAEAELYRRGVEGVDKPVFYKGEQVDTIREYDTTALIFLLKNKRKATYGDKITVVDERLDSDIQDLLDQMTAKDPQRANASG